MNGVGSRVGNQASSITTAVSPDTKVKSRTDLAKASFLQLPRETIAQKLIGSYKVSSVSPENLKAFRQAAVSKLGADASPGQMAALERKFFSASSFAHQSKIDDFFAKVDDAKNADHLKEVATILRDVLGSTRGLAPRWPPKVPHLWPRKLLHPGRGDLTH